MHRAGGPPAPVCVRCCWRRGARDGRAWAKHAARLRWVARRHGQPATAVRERPPLNVRCPHCSAVFPSGPLPDSGSRAVECPLCLLRFDAKGEGTVSVAQAAPTGRAGSADDEFEQFGLGGQVQAAINTGLTVPLVSSPGGPSAPPVAPRTMAPARPMAPADDEVDFEALLSDAVGAVEKYDRGAPA